MKTIQLTDAQLKFIKECIKMREIEIKMQLELMGTMKNNSVQKLILYEPYKASVKMIDELLIKLNEQ